MALEVCIFTPPAGRVPWQKLGDLGEVCRCVKTKCSVKLQLWVTLPLHSMQRLVNAMRDSFSTCDMSDADVVRVKNEGIEFYVHLYASNQQGSLTTS